jgi:hypothetical protein
MTADRDALHEVKLSYIDKQIAGLLALDQATARLWRLEALLSVVLIGLVVGIVSAEDNVELSGLNFELPLWCLLGGGSITLAVLAVLANLSDVQSTRLTRSIVTAYDELGFRQPRDDYRRGLGLMAAPLHAFGKLIDAPAAPARVFEGLVALTAVGSIVLLPLAAQVAVMIRLGSDFDWTVTSWLPLVFGLLLSSWSLVRVVAEPSVQ